jgi:D-alanine-D-alanine ligase
MTAEKKKLVVAVVFGGRSAEHEISLLSARNVVEALDRERFSPVLIGIDKSGRWLVQEEAALLAQARDPRLVRLSPDMPDARLLPYEASPSDHAITIGVEGRGPVDVDVVFPVLHGPMGEDGSVQGLLTLANVPFVGSGTLGSAIGMDKDVMKRLLAAAGLPIVRHVVVRGPRFDRSEASVLDEAEALGPVVFVKPANLGSSVGVSKATSRGELRSAIARALAFDDKVIVEAAVTGVRELECAVLGNDEPVASRVGEVVVTHPDGFYSYDAKYVDETGATTRIPADLSAEEEQAVQRLSIDTFRVLECAGMARVDFFRAAAGTIYVNEVNTIPGFTAISMYPKLWEASGIGPRDLVTRLIELALERAEQKSKLRTTVD